MDRRKFLHTMAALGAAAFVPNVTEAAVAVETAVNPNAKYCEAMRLFDRCVPYANNSVEVTVRFDELLGYLKDNFTAPEINEENVETTRLLLCNHYSIVQLRSVPPAVADTVYPIALAKLGLTSYKMPLRVSKMENFTWFHDTYGRLVTDAMAQKIRRL